MSFTKPMSTLQVQQLTGWSLVKIRALIAQGKLPAINTSTGNRPIWQIRLEDLESFLTPKSMKVAKPTRSSNRRIDADVPKVFG